MLYRVRAQRAALIDVTPAVCVVHQNHDYAHHPGGKAGAHKEGAEARQNVALAGGEAYLFTLWDATHLLTPGGLCWARGRRNLLRHIDTIFNMCGKY